MYYAGVSLTWQLGINGCSYDCQWRTCPGLTVKNKIQYWSDGSTFDVNSKKTRSEQHVGDIVSKYGVTTNYTAGQITSTIVFPASQPITGMSAWKKPKEKDTLMTWRGEWFLLAMLALRATAKQSAERPSAMRKTERNSIKNPISVCHSQKLVSNFCDSSCDFNHLTAPIIFANV